MIHWTSWRHGVAAAAFALSGALAACGGGGGGDSQPPVQVTLSSTTAAVSFPSNTGAVNAPQTTVTATLANPPTTPVYVVVQDSGKVMQGPAAFFTNPDGSYTAMWTYDMGLAPGTYTGTFQLKLCKDQGCGDAYQVSGGSMSYTVTVTPTATFTATVNGVPTTLQTNDAPGFTDRPLTLNLKSGDVLSIQASQPVSWDLSFGGVMLGTVTQTPTSWTGVLLYGMSGAGLTGVLSIDAYYLPDVQFSSALAFGVTE